MALFETENEGEQTLPDEAPLAARMRPRNLEEFVGQQHFLAEGRLLWRMIKADRVSSLIFYGPPGTGKTALAYIVAQNSRARFVSLNATTTNVAQVRDALAAAVALRRRSGRRSVLFVDELHRFNRWMSFTGSTAPSRTCCFRTSSAGT